MHKNMSKIYIYGNWYFSTAYTKICKKYTLLYLFIYFYKPQLSSSKKVFIDSLNTITNLFFKTGTGSIWCIIIFWLHVSQPNILLPVCFQRKSPCFKLRFKTSCRSLRQGFILHSILFICQILESPVCQVSLEWHLSMQKVWSYRLVWVKWRAWTVFRSNGREKFSLQINTFLEDLPTIYNDQLQNNGLQNYNFWPKLNVDSTLQNS